MRRLRFIRQIPLALLLAASCQISSAQMSSAAAADPIKLGFSEPLTGGFAGTGRVMLAAVKIWADDVNAKGGLLGRQVQLVYYDDQSQGSNVPGIYIKLLDVDKVDLVITPYSTALTAAAMPVIIEHGKAVVSVSSLNVNNAFHYNRYFSMTNTGPNPNGVFSRGFFHVAMQQNPKPQTVALAYADLEFSKNAIDGAHAIIKELGLKIVYDRSYPPSTVDFAPIIHAVQATNPDIFFISSYPPDSVGMVRAVNEIGFKPKMFGGATTGLNNVSAKTVLGPLLNGVVGYENWLPAPTLMFPGVADFLKKYQAVAKEQGFDPLGYGAGPSAYAQAQVLGLAVEGAQSLDPDKIAAYLHSHKMSTVWGDVTFGEDGEWAEPRFLVVQYQHITGKTLDQFTDPAKMPVIDPPEFKSGDLIYPYAAAQEK
jgi:branched-chain amino acid transport system substrate-binding protein